MKDRRVQPSPDSVDASRRNMASGLLAVAGAVALAGCAQEASAHASSNEQALNGSDQKWVDTVLGPGFPGSRDGDLATKTGPQISATVVVAKGCRIVGDGGGGMFYWDPVGGTDNGGTIIVPNAAIGSTGPCWKRIGR